MRRDGLGWMMMLALAACDGNSGGGDDAGNAEHDAGSDAGPAIDCTGRPADAPSTRGELNGVLDTARDRIVVYGGNAAAPIDCMPMYDIIDETWALHLDCASWERLSPAGGPGRRARHATTLDTQRNRMILFGGRDRSSSGEYTNYADVWAFDLATDTWTEILTSGTGPSPRSSAVAVYDAPRDRLVVFGGNISTSGLTLTGTDDLFALDLSTGEWTPIDAGPGPAARLFHAGVILDDDLVVFGGTPTFDGPFHADTWTLDLTTDTWRILHDGAGDAPNARFGGELFADPARGRVLLAMGHDFGPPSGPGNMNDLWAFELSGASWTRLQAGDVLTNPEAGFCDFPADFTTPQEGAPERRYSFVHVASDSLGYVFGGKTDCGNINDVWTIGLESGAWSQLRPPTGGEACNRSGRTGCTSLCF